MAAHVFDATEPTLDPISATPMGTVGSTSTVSASDAPMFASRPAVFDKVHERQRVGAGPLIGLAVGAVLVGGLVFAMSRHNHAASHPASASQTSSHALIAAGPAPTAEATPAPVKATAAPAPAHLRIVSAPPAGHAMARVAARPARAPVVRTRAAAPSAPAPRALRAPAPAPEATVTPPAALSIAPAPAPAPSLSTPAPEPTPQPAPAPSSAAPDAPASAGPAPQ